MASYPTVQEEQRKVPATITTLYKTKPKSFSEALRGMPAAEDIPDDSSESTPRTKNSRDSIGGGGSGQGSEGSSLSSKMTATEIALQIENQALQQQLKAMSARLDQLETQSQSKTQQPTTITQLQQNHAQSMRMMQEDHAAQLKQMETMILSLQDKVHQLTYGEVSSPNRKQPAKKQNTKPTPKTMMARLSDMVAPVQPQETQARNKHTAPPDVEQMEHV